MGEVYKVNIKWGKEVFKDVEVNTSEPIETFLTLLYSLTSVPPAGQKVMVPRSGALKPDADWSKYKIKNGATWMLVGTAEEQHIKPPTEKVVFAEDLTPEQLGTMKVTKYPAGLINLGNTCYLNSTLQMLFSVPELRASLTGTRPNAGQPNAQVLRAMTELCGLVDQSSNAALPMAFLAIFRQHFPQFDEHDGQGRYSQQDADEAFQSLMQCLALAAPVSGPERDRAAEAAPAPNRNVVTQLFTGQMVSSLKCVEAEDAPEESGPPDTFFKLTCHIDEKTNYLYDGLSAALKEHITKHAPSLGRDAVFEKSSRIARLPHYLSIQFVRFWWNQAAKVKAKITRPVEFPFRLDMLPYCSDELRAKLMPARRALSEWELEQDRLKKEKKKGGADASSAGADADAGTSAEGAGAAMDVEGAEGEKGSSEMQVADGDAPEFYENQTGFYDLQAVVTHKGRTADSGHYVAWVKHDDQWLLFDDDKVSPRTEDDIKKLVGKGGADWHIAYLCLYKSVPAPPAAAASSTSDAGAAESATSS